MNVMASFVLPCSWPHPVLVHWQEAARGLVDVDDAICADSVLVHEPAQLDEEPVRVGVLLLWAVELLQALGGLLEAQAHAMQESLHLAVAGTHAEPLCVEPLEHQAVDRVRAHAQDVRHLHDVLAEPRGVCGRQHPSFPSGAARGALRFQR